MDTTPEVDIDLTLCVPCFNEETRVTGTLETIRADKFLHNAQQ